MNEKTDLRKNKKKKTKPNQRTAMMLVAALLLVAAGATAHLCILNPPQRGALNISDAGDPSCFRHGAVSHGTCHCVLTQWPAKKLMMRGLCSPGRDGHALAGSCCLSLLCTI